MRLSRLHPLSIFLEASALFWIFVTGLQGVQSESGNSCTKEAIDDNLVLSTPEECARECVEGAPPKICYHQFTLEFYTVLGKACSLCTANNTDSITSDCQCVSADGVERGILTVNRMLPGPSIHVCKGDKIVIDLKNDMPGLETTIHWHGILQKGSQYYDGVPMLTQCPIHHGTTFRYQYYADNEGTHFWHAHDGTQKMDGIHGKLIVRVPRSKDPNSHLYDFDKPEHAIILADWMHDFAMEHLPGRITSNVGHDPVSALINGQGRFTNLETGETTNTSLAEFNVESGYKYRFRIINSFCSTCPAELIFEGHDLTLIAVDGVPVRPAKINTIISFPGERFDVVMEANQSPSDYWMQLRALGGCANAEIQQLAIIRYSGDQARTTSEQPTYNSSLPTGITLSPLDGICNETRSDAVCINQLKSAVPVNKRILTKEPDIRIYIPVSFTAYTNEQLFEPNTYQHFTIPGGRTAFAANMDNISHVFPPSPSLSQYGDIPSSQYCNDDNRPQDCGSPCMCSHKIDFPMNKVVEVFLTDGVGVATLSHPIHMHGYAFNVMSMGKSPYANVTQMYSHHARQLDREGRAKRRFDSPPFKDTIAIPTGGYAIIRFVTDNPGYWLFHCHFLYHHIAGMEMILHVGNDCRDLPPVPANFPVCGDHLPPIEFDSY